MSRDWQQLDLYDHARRFVHENPDPKTEPPVTPPYQQHSETSKAAAKEITPHVNRCHRLILDHLRYVGAEGATDQELEDATGMGGSTVRPRRIELVKKELVEDSGRTRETRAGRKATVWVAV